MRKKEIDFTQTLIEITKEEIRKGELGQPLVFFYKDNSIGALAYNNWGNHKDKLDNLSVQIRTLIRSLKKCTIGVILEGTVTGADGCSDTMILTIEDGITCKKIFYSLDKDRKIIDENENISNISDCPVLRFQNFFKIDYVFNKHNVEKIISKDITITDYKTDILNMVKNVTLVTEKDLELSFVLYKKKKSNKLFSAMLDYKTSTKDIDLYFDNRKNELVSWIKYYKVINNKTNIDNEMIWVYNRNMKTDIMLYDLYKINDDRSLTVIENNLLLPKI
jgi:hypothetical protein